MDAACSLVEAIQTAQSANNFGSCEAATPAQPNTIVLPTNSDQPFSTAFNNGTISDPNLYTATPFITSTLTIEGNNSTVRKVSSAQRFRLFAVTDGALTLNNLTVSGGVLAGIGSGSGIYVGQDDSLTLNNVTVSGNTATSASAGGGLFSLGGTVTINNSEFSNNYAEGNGGAMFVSLSEASISSSTITQNTAGKGGGLFLNETNLTISQNSLISENYATTTGAGMHASNGNSINISNSTLRANDTGSNGGGIYTAAISAAQKNRLSLTNSTLTSNSASESGGGVFLSSSDTMVMSNSTVHRNSAYRFGGAFYVFSNAQLELDTVTVSGSSAAESGGALALIGAGVFSTITKSTISGGSANFAGGLLVQDGANVVLTNSTVSGNRARQVGAGLAAVAGGSYVRMTNSTLVNNSTSQANSFGAGISMQDSAELELFNSLVSGNSATIASSFANDISLLSNATGEVAASLIGDSAKTSTESFSSDLQFNSDVITATANGTTPTAADNIFSDLRRNDGVTFTHGLVEGSPALDTGNQNFCDGFGITEDQRGRPRDDGNCDNGAFEGIEEPIEETCFSIPFNPGKAVVFCL